MRPDHLSLLRTPSTPAVHPDGTWAVIALSHPDLDEDAYPSRLWRLDLDDGAMRPLTHGHRDSGPVMSPDGRHVAFIRAGAETKPQLALLPTGGGEPMVLTDHPVGVSGPVEFSPDSTRIAYTARVPEPGRYGTAEGVGPEAEPPRHITRFTYRLDGVGFYADRSQHVFVIDVPEPEDAAAAGGGMSTDAGEPGTAEDGDSRAGAKGASAADQAQAERLSPARKGVPVAPVQVTAGEQDHGSQVWDHDGQSLLVIRSVVDQLRTEIIRVPVGGDRTGAPTGDGEATATIPEPQVLRGPAHGANALRTGEGETLWLLSSDLGPDGMDFIGKTPVLFRARLTEAGISDLEPCTDPRTGSLSPAVFLVQGEEVLLTRLNRGSTELVRYRDGALEPVFAGQVSVAGATPMPGGGVVLTAATTDSAGEVYVVDDHDGQEPVRRLTDLSAPLRAAAPVAIPREMEIDGEDGYPVHGWVTIPEGDGPHPVLLLIHGGPHAQYEPVLFDEVQVYTRAGYAVVFCNPRGSSGYGMDHGRAIIEGFGDRDAADVLAFLDGALAAHPQLDAERVGVLGGSYGGYMAAWLTTRTDRFTAAIVERGFLDPVSFEGSADIGWFFGIKYLGEDPERVAAQSPMAHIDKVNTPTLVIHSEQDWRCPVEQGQRWFVGLKRRGVDSEFLLFPGEGHELSRSGRPKHRLARFEHILAWWDKHLPVR